MKQSVLLTAVLLVGGAPVIASAQAEHDHSHTLAAECHGRAARSPTCQVEMLLLARLNGSGVPGAMAALDSVAAADIEVRRIGHSYAHAIGLAGYDGAERVGEVFSQCTASFQSGCYHGVIQAYFDEQRMSGGTPDAAMLNDLCANPRSDSASSFELFQCVHGLGHGLMLAEEGFLPGALDGCDLLAIQWESEVCYSAVFMENIVQATTQRGDLGRPAGHAAAAHGEPGHAHATAREPFPNLKPDDPLYPCNVLDERYLGACYQMQTSAILQQNGFDLREAAEACADAPDTFVATCYQSLGRDISAITVQDDDRAVTECGYVPAEQRHFCYLGYAKNLVDLEGEIGPGVAFCSKLTEPRDAETCFIGMGEEIWVLFHDLPVREQQCRSIPATWQNACRYGAGLTESAAIRQPPSALPGQRPN